jgi:hypothetical protein
VTASNFGAHKNPAWYYNIKANPEVTLLGRGLSGSFLAEQVVGPERDRLFHFAAGHRRHTTITSSRRQPDRSP